MAKNTQKTAYQKWFESKYSTFKGRHSLEYRYARSTLKNFPHEFTAKRIERIIKNQTRMAKADEKLGNHKLAADLRNDAAAWQTLLNEFFCPHCKSRLVDQDATEDGYYTAGKLCTECGYTTCKATISFSEFLTLRARNKELALISERTGKSAAARAAWAKYSWLGTCFAAYTAKELRLQMRKAGK